MRTSVVQDGTEFPQLPGRQSSRTAFLVVTERGEAGWGAYVPDLPGVVAAGATEDEVLDLIGHAVELQLEGMREDGDMVPEPSSRASWVIG